MNWYNVKNVSVCVCVCVNIVQSCNGDVNVSSAFAIRSSRRLVAGSDPG